MVARAIQATGEGLETELVPIKTSGDEKTGGRGQARDRVGGGTSRQEDKSRFVKEIEEALLRGEVDLGVHSAKDVPSTLPQGLAIVGAPAAEDARDALVGSAGSLDDLPHGARVGTSSLRRRSQLLAIRPDLDVAGLRGNVDTRLRKLFEGGYDAIVLALAGLRRLGRGAEAGAALDVEEFVPAPGQGILVLEARSDDSFAADRAAAISDPSALERLEAERAVVATLEASCRTPVGVHARTEQGSSKLLAYAGLPDGSEWIRDEVAGDRVDPAALGRMLAERMLAAGAGELLERADRFARIDSRVA